MMFAVMLTNSIITGQCWSFQILSNRFCSLNLCQNKINLGHILVTVHTNYWDESKAALHLSERLMICAETFLLFLKSSQPGWLLNQSCAHWFQIPLKNDWKTVCSLKLALCTHLEDWRHVNHVVNQLRVKVHCPCHRMLSPKHTNLVKL